MILVCLKNIHTILYLLVRAGPRLVSREHSIFFDTLQNLLTARMCTFASRDTTDSNPTSNDTHAGDADNLILFYVGGGGVFLLTHTHGSDPMSRETKILYQVPCGDDEFIRIVWGSFRAAGGRKTVLPQKQPAYKSS